MGMMWSIGLGCCAAMGILVIDALSPFAPAFASCSMEHSTNAESFARRLGKDCSDQERRAQAISAEELLDALKNGQSLNLEGIVIEGDLFLDRLPPTQVMLDDWPPRIQETMRARQWGEPRQILGSISIRDSVVRGAIGARLKDGVLLVKGPVTMTGTIFERPVDFSRTVFVGAVDFSDVIFLREGFFIQAVFDQSARFERAMFGVHTRFHRAVFRDRAIFLRAGFSGLAELLEVSFEKEASFSRANFKMGTGFSGSRFSGDLDFSETLVERDIYFLFSVFEKTADFRRSTFRGQADFSDAQFQGRHDFTKVSFTIEPNFTRTKMHGDPPRRSSLQAPHIVYEISATVAVFLVVFVLVRRKR